MSLIQWNENLSVHVPELDRQHQRLIDLINKLHAAMVQGKGAELLRPLLDEVLQYTVTHFDAEEKYMQQVKYPDFATHRAEHEQLKRKARELVSSLENGSARLSVPTMNFLRDWLTNHIQRVDRKYAPQSAPSAK
jgi:hemerythrin